MAIGQVRVASIMYRTDVGRTDAEELPLGVLAFFDDTTPNRPDMTMLILLARADLDPAWEQKMDPLARILLSNPIQFFQEKIDLIARDKSADIMVELAREFSWSIAISAPAEIKPTAEMMKFLGTLADDARTSDETPAIHPLYDVNVLMHHHSSALGEVTLGVVGDRKPSRDLFAQIAGPELQDVVNVDSTPPAWMIGSDRIHGNRVH